MTADLSEDLVRAWASGWSRARRVAPPVEVAGGLKVHLGLPERVDEYIALDPSGLPELCALAQASVTDDWVTATTTGPDVAASAMSAAGLRVEERFEWFMTTSLAEHPVRALPDGYTSSFETHDGVVFASLRDSTGARAGGGRMSLDDIAVADKIETAADHRRRGLGGALVSALVMHALDAGCRRGVLVASLDGERLYSHLGWHSIGRVVVARTPPKR